MDDPRLGRGLCGHTARSARGGRPGRRRLHDLQPAAESGGAHRIPAHDCGRDRRSPQGPRFSQRRGAPGMNRAYAVVVVGGGNAGLVAAISARHVVDSVLLLERAPAWQRGGNSRHTRDIRYAHAAGEAYTTGEAYPVEELVDDLLRVGGGHNRQLAMLVCEQSCSVADWMAAHGVRWQQPLTGTLHLGRTNRFFLGGGKALINTYYL